MRKILLTTFLLLTFLFPQTQDESNEIHMEETNNHHNDGNGSMVNNSSESATKAASIQNNSSTSEIIDAYLQLKNALTEDNKEKAAEAGNAILAAFSNFNISQLTEDEHKEYMEIVENAKEQAEHIVKSPIDHQREHFEVLSNDVKDLIALLGIETGTTLYETFCPMYNNPKGAMWLSETDEIKNPFYGSKMLKCGKVQKQMN
ncbi:MAG TPA: DUF3347 domain-containing protein [Candidatus Marinimicrobia bacterium]|jgi:hypothetical protein|nr:DUF3347 domain-containing protein [Candidatus Neomarinimicrobiota bacterium]